MLWSLLKIVMFIALVAGATYGASVLSEMQGGLRVTFGATEFNLEPLQAAVALLLLILAVWILLKIVGLFVAAFRFLNGDETALSRYFDRNRERRGYEALAEGMTALAAGEGRLAMARAAKAEKYLRRPELTSLIMAQAAELSGDRKKAQEVYKRLLKDGRTRFVGVRGLMRQKLEEGDTALAMKLAEHAFALKPRHVETGDLLLRLQAEGHDWAGARRTLALKKRHGQLPRDVHRRRDAVLALSQARDMSAEGRSAEAREAAIEANRLSPDLVPAAAMAAKALMEQGKPRLAARILKKAWAAQPHPDLAAAFAALQPEEDPQARLKRFRPLLDAAPQDPETRMLEAELHVAAGDFAAARRAIADLVEKAPTARSLALMAAIERGEGGDDAVVRGWLARAVTAPRGPQWVCENCHAVHPGWVAVCANCGGFDTLAWKEPPAGETAMPASGAMLPLIVGRGAGPADDGPGSGPSKPVAAPQDQGRDTREGPGGENAADSPAGQGAAQDGGRVAAMPENPLGKGKG